MHYQHRMERCYTKSLVRWRKNTLWSVTPFHFRTVATQVASYTGPDVYLTKVAPQEPDGCTTVLHTTAVFTRNAGFVANLSRCALDGLVKRDGDRRLYVCPTPLLPTTATTAKSCAHTTRHRYKTSDQAMHRGIGVAPTAPRRGHNA